MLDFTERKDRDLRRKYGITLDVWNAMYAAQRGRCAICDRSDQRLVVDHDHHSGAVRGLLCVTCNSGLGMLQDDPDLLDTARDYILGIRYVSDD
jgi:hypothetical protein